MTHLHEATSLKFECGELFEIGTGKTFDMTVITFWPEGNYPPIIVGYYFGEYNRDTTDEYIEDYFVKRARNSAWIDFLCDARDIVDAYRITNEGVLDDDTSEKVERVLSILKKTMLDDSIH